MDIWQREREKKRKRELIYYSNYIQLQVIGPFILNAQNRINIFL